MLWHLLQRKCLNIQILQSYHDINYLLHTKIWLSITIYSCINPLNVELNPICHLVALLGAHRILHVSSIRVKPFVCICWFLCHFFSAYCMLMDYLKSTVYILTVIKCLLIIVKSSLCFHSSSCKKICNCCVACSHSKICIYWVGQKFVLN